MALNFTAAPENKYVWNVPSTLYYVYLALHIGVPMFVIPLLYIRINATVKQSSRNAGCTTLPKRSDVKLAKTIGFVIGFLFLVWIPVVILEVFYNFHFSECIVEQAGTVSVWITCINGAINPMVYSYRNSEVRKYVIKLLNWFRCSKKQLSSQLRNKNSVFPENNTTTKCVTFGITAASDRTNN